MNRNLSRVLVIVPLASLVAAQDAGVLFRTEARLVEVYATVFDHRGRYLNGLTRHQFEVRDNGAPQQVIAFEAETARISCAILLDTTGSMARVLPLVKNAINKFIDELRDRDEVAVHSFTTSLRKLQEFTTDRAAAKGAVSRTRAEGGTALFDAISQLARELSRRSGKKVMIVFTDGADNASVLNAGAASARAKKAGIPVYTVAQGDALKSSALLRELREISQITGAHAYCARTTQTISRIFEDIAGDVQHTYMLAYRPPPAQDQRWRSVQVNVSGVKHCRIRAKEGYFPE